LRRERGMESANLAHGPVHAPVQPDDLALNSGVNEWRRRASSLCSLWSDILPGINT
jgi:hypothetical protein